jgi:threonine aldolase
MPALLARDGLSTFPRDIARAHARAARHNDAHVASGKVRDISNPNPSNLHRLAMAQDFAAAAFERGRQAGVRMGHWKDGDIPLFVNTSLLRRPVEELAALFLG